MKRIMVEVRRFLKTRFNLNEDDAAEQEVVRSIRKNVEFRGANLWTLIFAIIIASIGLNVNSTAVIIGAMLISPLMGPIMGVGLGIGINDLALVRSSSKNLFIAAFFSIITSTLYFWATPLHEAQSEILARTTPSVWDVFIAFTGGFAGIIAATRKEKTNVIPGVAIATALMPPLCTAGYGLATGNLYYFLGALYLFFINSVFICISTYLVVRYLKFHKKAFEDKGLERRVSRTILAIVIFTTAPSIYLAYRIVDRSIFESNAQKFVEAEFSFTKTQVINRAFNIRDGKKMIDLLLIGKTLPDAAVDSIRAKLTAYGLDKVELNIRQGLNERSEVDFAAIKASIMKDVLAQADSLGNGNGHYILPEQALGKELQALYPGLQSFFVSRSAMRYVDTTAVDSLTLVWLHFNNPPVNGDREKIRAWLTTRLQADSVKMIIE